MVKLLKQSSISFVTSEKHKGSTGGLQRKAREREPGQRHSNKNIKPDERKTISLLTKPKDDRTYEGG